MAKTTKRSSNGKATARPRKRAGRANWASLQLGRPYQPLRSGPRADAVKVAAEILLHFGRGVMAERSGLPAGTDVEEEQRAALFEKWADFAWLFERLAEPTASSLTDAPRMRQIWKGSPAGHRNRVCAFGQHFGRLAWQKAQAAAGAGTPKLTRQVLNEALKEVQRTRCDGRKGGGDYCHPPVP